MKTPEQAPRQIDKTKNLNRPGISFGAREIAATGLAAAMTVGAVGTANAQEQDTSLPQESPKPTEIFNADQNNDSVPLSAELLVETPTENSAESLVETITQYERLERIINQEELPEADFDEVSENFLSFLNENPKVAKKVKKYAGDPEKSLKRVRKELSKDVKKQDTFLISKDSLSMFVKTYIESDDPIVADLIEDLLGATKDIVNQENFTNNNLYFLDTFKYDLTEEVTVENAESIIDDIELELTPTETENDLEDTSKEEEFVRDEFEVLLENKINKKVTFSDVEENINELFQNAEYKKEFIRIITPIQDEFFMSKKSILKNLKPCKNKKNNKSDRVLHCSGNIESFILYARQFPLDSGNEVHAKINALFIDTANITRSAAANSGVPIKELDKIIKSDAEYFNNPI